MDPKLEILSNQLLRIETLLEGACGISPWLTTAEAASYLRCSVSKIEQLTKRGLLPFQRQDPTHSQSPRIYHRKYLLAFLITGNNCEKHRLSAEEKRLVEELL